MISHWGSFLAGAVTGFVAGWFAVLAMAGRLR